MDLCPAVDAAAAAAPDGGLDAPLDPQLLAHDLETGGMDTQLITELNTESYQANVHDPAHAESLLQDAHNLYYSHMPRLLGTAFRFQVGEVAYIKWRGELNVVVVHFVSHKLVTAAERPQHSSSETDDASSSATDEASATPPAPPAPPAKPKPDKKRVDHEKVDDSASDAVTDSDAPPPQADRSDFADDTVKPEPLSGPMIDDNNAKLFVDPCSRALYGAENAIKPLQLRCDKDASIAAAGQYVVPEEQLEESAGSEPPFKRYFIPMYFVTFPGYKKRCAKTFRFWVKEKDLIKYNTVKQSPRRFHKPVIDPSRESGATHEDKPWVSRDIEDINEYVYNVVYNTYREDALSARYQRAEDLLPWCVPRALQLLVLSQQHRVLRRSQEVTNLYAVDAAETLYSAPLSERLSAYAVIQNFKYVVILIATLMKRAGENAAGGKPKSEGEGPSAEVHMQKIDVEEINIPSLRFLEQLETTVGSGISAQQFQELYVNNFYWLDVYLHWMDTCFTDFCCYNEKELEFLWVIRHTHPRPLCRVLGMEHLARMFCFPAMYRALLKRIYRQRVPFRAYLPITQLLLHYMALVEVDYTHDQHYSLSHTGGDFLKRRH